MSDLAIATLVVTIIGFIPLYLDLILRMRERRINFVLQRVYESRKNPIESNLGIRIWHPDKLIERCRIFYNDTPLPWWDSENECYYERLMVKGGGGIVLLPLNANNEEAKIVVKDGTKKLMERKLKDIPVSKA